MRTTSPRPQDERIRQLEDELYRARVALIEMTSEAAKEILCSTYSVTTWQELSRWADAAAAKVIELCENVTTRTYQGHPLESPRALCPLCGTGPQSFYDGNRGFSLPTGLARHLTGWGNARECPVFGAAQAIVRDRIIKQELKAGLR